MSKIIKGDTALRYQLDNNNKGKFTEIPWEFITCISVSGTNIVIDSDIDPNPQNIVIPYAAITEPVTASITNLKELLWCWVLSKSRKHSDENGDKYIYIIPDVDPCFGVIDDLSCEYVLQNVNGTLYWNGDPLSGGGVTTVESGLYQFNPTTARLGGILLEDVRIDGDGFRVDFTNLSNFTVNGNSVINLTTNDGTYTSNNELNSNVIRNKVDDTVNITFSEAVMTSTDITTQVVDFITPSSSTNTITTTSQKYTSSAVNNATIIIDAFPNIIFSCNDTGLGYTSSTGLNYNAFTINAGLKLGLPQFITSTPTIADDLKNFFPVRTNLGAFTLIIPFAMCESGRIFIVKDVGNNASVNNITIDSAIGNIEGAATYTINTNRGSATFICDGADWWLI